MKALKKWFASLVFVSLFFGAGGASAQMVVHDPVTFVQEGLQLAEQLQTVTNQATQIRRQIQQIALATENLKQLSSGDLAALRETFRQLDSLYRQAEQISMRWEQISQEFERTYERYNPEEHSADDYQELRARWSQQTNNATRSAMQAHGVVEEYEQRERNLERYLSASDSATGTLAAIQAGNKMTAMVARQMMELSSLMVADSRARLSRLAEESARDDSARARTVEHFMRDYGAIGQPSRVRDSFARIR